MLEVRPVLRHFLAWLVLLPVFWLEQGALTDFLEERRLHTPGEYLSTSGQITETRGGQDGNIEIRYAFEVNGETYSASDAATRRRNLWIPIERGAWETAVENDNRIEIIYLPDNPWANEPRQRAGIPVGDTFAGWLLFLGIDAWSIFEFTVIFRNYAKCRESAESNFPLKLRYWEAKEI